jgi:hypothetical protein
MIRLAVGPVRPAASWAWIGRDMAAALSGDYAVTLFESFETAPAADIVFAVKHRPPERFAAEVQTRQARLVYAPVDIYQDQAEVAADAPMLARCDLVLLHGETLLPYIAPYTSRIEMAEHHLRFALDEPAPYRKDGYVLWVGAAGNLPHLLKFLASHPLPYELRLLTDAFVKERRIAAHYLAARMGVCLQFGKDEVNGFPAFAWSEAAQAQMMRACRAALDIKGQDFNQSTKPPAKAQKFIASGIPFACNEGSPMAHYFLKRGFELAQPEDTARLFSHDYWNETRQEAARLRQKLSFGSVSAAYRGMFQNLMKQ